jgi:Na+-driven multidrug efflux pump
VVYILMMITQSTTGGLQPIASYNFGAKLYDRVKDLIKVGIGGNLIAVYVLAILFWIAATPVCTLFIGAGSELIPIAAKYTRVVVSCTALGLTANLMSGYFQAVERVIESTVLGICRYIIFGIPAIFIMANMLGITGVWFSQPVSDILSFALSLVLAGMEIKRLKNMKTA